MRSSTRSIAFRFAVIALAFGLVGAVQAADMHTSTTVQNNQQATADGASETRTDWNIDYPSQLGPEGPRVTTLTASQKDTSVARQSTSR
jgi:hypothetical protein